MKMDQQKRNPAQTHVSMICCNKKLVQHRWADWSHISKQEDLKSVIPLFESCKLTQFYGFQQRYDENIIREFYGTLYIPEDKMKLFWMFRG
jgi:hypothetical protein